MEISEFAKQYQQKMFGDEKSSLAETDPEFIELLSLISISILAPHFGQYISIDEPSPAFNNLYPQEGHTT